MTKPDPKKIGLEAIVTVLNRVSNPICIFVSIAFLSRTLSQTNFENFLITFSISQWGLLIGFQWIKNSIVKTFRSSNFFYLTTYASLGSSLVVSTFIFTTLKMDFITSISVTLFTLSNGIIYITVTRRRIQGEIVTPQSFELSGVAIRWTLGCLCAEIFQNIHSIFLAMTLVNVLTILLTFRSKLNINLPQNAYQVKKFVVLSISLLVTDISSSTMLYLDRIVTKDASLIIHSTIGTQATTVIFGALLAMIIPRIALKATIDTSWPRKHVNYSLIFLAFSIPSLFFIYISGPIALDFIAPDIEPNAVRLTWYAAAQLTHFAFTLFALYFVLKHRSYIPAIIYLFCCALYVTLVKFYPEYIQSNYPILRFSILALAGVTLWLIRLKRNLD